MRPIFRSPLPRIRGLLSCLAVCSLTAVSAQPNDFFSRTYGEKWIRITYAPNTGYAWSQPSAGGTPAIQATDYSTEAQLWCFVGTAKGFKIYNRATGKKQALTAAPDSPGEETRWTEAAKAIRWTLNGDSLTARKSPGYRFLPAGLKASPQTASIGGQKGLLKVQAASAEASRWRIADASAVMQISARTEGSASPRVAGPDLAVLRITCDTARTIAGSFSINIDDRHTAAPQTYYIPAGGTLGIQAEETYRGYEFKGFGYGTNGPLFQHLYLSCKDRGNKPLHVTVHTSAVPDSGAFRLFHTGDKYGVPYRIPAIATARNGHLVALSDRRYCGADIGYGHIDMVARVSKDNGATWEDDYIVLKGTGQGKSTGYGDACLVADREENRLLLVCVAGNVSYAASRRNNPQLMVRSYGTYNNKTGRWEWSAPEEFTESIYEGLFKGRINGLFMGSGRICQSRRVRVGSAYRLYAALCTHRGNYVIYSDDFGKNWNVLGDAVQSCAPQGDEPKCEELPDGSVLLSSRKNGGRFFNIFKYSDVKTAAGQWGTAVDSRTVRGGISNAGTPTNGEILIVRAIRKADKQPVHLVLQSIPAGPGRQKVTIYYKALAQPSDYDTPEHFAAGWEGSYRVTDRKSAYSTLTLQADGRLAFYYEEEPAWYQMIYQTLSIETVTNGAYSLAENYRGEAYYAE